MGDVPHPYVRRRALLRDMIHYRCDMTQSHVLPQFFVSATTCATLWHDSFCDMTHSYVWYDSWIYAAACSALWHDSSIRVIWLMHTCDMVHPCMPRCVLLCDTTHLSVWHDSFTCAWHVFFNCVTCLFHVRDTIQFYAWNDSFVCVGVRVCVCVQSDK